MKLHKISLLLLYSLTLLMVIYLVAAGFEYYNLPLVERPRHALHADWKPGGLIGHGVGVIGSLMMVLLLLYSVRKRFRFMHRFGNIRYWLNYHIWLGITGPLLVIFHSSFKFHGIIAISFWSMIAVALSGVFGRYLYLQIPHNLSGEDLSASDIRERETQMTNQLRDAYGVSGETVDRIFKTIGAGQAGSLTAWSVMFSWLLSDLKLPFTLMRLRRILSADHACDAAQIREIIGLARRLAVLKRRIVFFGKTKQLLHYWHIIHRPFAAVMLVIMLVHSVIAILFGYKWIF
jgi:hypothetical protein